MLTTSCIGTAGGGQPTAATDTDLATSTVIQLPGAWTATISPPPSPTPYPSNTPVATRVAHRSLRRISDLPAWLGDPGTPVIMSGRGLAPGGYYGQVTMINAATGEAFELPLYGIEYFLWLDNIHIGFLGDSFDGIPREMTVLSLVDGQMSVLLLTEDMVRHVGTRDGVEPLTQRGSWTDPSNFYLLSDHRESSLSSDSRYQANAGIKGELWVTDLLTGQGVQLSSDNDGHYHRGAAWSPTGPYIAELQERSDPREDDPIADRIAVYHAPTAMRVAFIDVQVASVLPSTPIWSPDGKDILFLKHSADVPNGGVPCLYAPASGQLQCLPNVADFADDPMWRSIRWSFTGRQIRYLICDDSTKVSALHLYDLKEGILKALDDGFLGHAERVIVSYKPSPDDAYLLVTHDANCRRFDSEPVSTELGVYNLEAEEFIAFPHEWYDFLGTQGQSYPGTKALWRPGDEPTETP